MLSTFYRLGVSAYLLLPIPEQIAVCDVPLIVCLYLGCPDRYFRVLRSERMPFLKVTTAPPSLGELRIGLIYIYVCSPVCEPGQISALPDFYQLSGWSALHELSLVLE